MGEIIETDGGGGAPEHSAIVYNIPDLKTMAAKILRRANEVAQQTLASAKQSVAEQEKQGRAEGEKKGYADGLKKAEAEGRAAGDKAAREEFIKRTETLAPALEAALSEMNQRKRALEAEAEADLLRLSMEIARRIVRREVQLDPEFILPIVREAVALTNNRSDLLIWLNPADKRVVAEELPALKAIFSDLGRVELREDTKVERGGVRVMNREGEVDMRLATQLHTLERALVGDADGLSLPAVPSSEPDVEEMLPESANDIRFVPSAEEEQPEDRQADTGASAPRAIAEQPAQPSVPAESLPRRQPAAKPAPAVNAQPARESAASPAAPQAKAAAPASPAADKGGATQGNGGVATTDDGFTPGLGIAGDDVFHPGVATELGGASALSGLLSLKDIPVDPKQERLIEAALREVQS